MNWRKLGLIFDLSKHTLPEGCFGYAQSPQPVVFADFVRVYFSTRRRDPRNEKVLSEVAFVDFTHDFSEVIKLAKEPVIQPGALGCFDEHGIFPMNVIRKGNALYGYTCGWSRRVSVSVETGIGVAISTDGGESFQRLGKGPVLAPSPREPFLVGDGFVLEADGKFHMWYIFGTAWRRFEPHAQPDRTYKIGYAESDDGISWNRPHDGLPIIPDSLGEAESQALPCVIRINGCYHMFFCFRHSYDFRTNPLRGYRLGHATSFDLRNWIRDDSFVKIGTRAGAWDSGMMCYPGVCHSNGSTYLLYNGNEFGRHGFGAAALEP